MSKVLNIVRKTYNIVLGQHNLLLNRRSASSLESKVKIGECNINYVKVGTGPHNVICMPGALGTIWSDFKPQVEGLDRNKFTVVAWDPPGYGKSRPPKRDFPVDFFEKDADAAFQLMKELNIPKFSVLGWSGGGTSGLILASKYPENIEKLAIWGAISLILPKEVEMYINIYKDTKTWSPKMRQSMIDIYGEGYFDEIWRSWLERMIQIYKDNKGDICSKKLKSIKCPVFILHGQKDPMIDGSHVSYLHSNIEKAKIHLYPDGKHNIHLRYAEDFNKRIEQFLSS